MVVANCIDLAHTCMYAGAPRPVSSSDSSSAPRLPWARYMYVHNVNVHVQTDSSQAACLWFPDSGSVGPSVQQSHQISYWLVDPSASGSSSPPRFGPTTAKGNTPSGFKGLPASAVGLFCGSAPPPALEVQRPAQLLRPLPHPLHAMAK